MLEPRVENSLDTAELAAPHVLHVVESTIHMGAKVAQASVVDQDPDQANIASADVLDCYIAKLAGSGMKSRVLPAGKSSVPLKEVPSVPNTE